MDNKNLVYRDLLIENFTNEIDALLDHFSQVMPKQYFETNSQSTILHHLSALVSARSSGYQDAISLTSQDGQQNTFIHSQSYPGLLSEILQTLPTTQPLRVARVYTAKDNSLVIDVFETQLDSNDMPFDASSRSDLVQSILSSQHHSNLINSIDQKMLTSFIQNVHHHYLNSFTLEEIFQHCHLVHQVRGTLDTQTLFMEHHDPELCFIVYTAGQTNSTSLFKRLANYCGRNHVDIRGAYLENFFMDSNDQTALVILEIKKNKTLDQSQHTTLFQELQRLPYINPSVLQLYSTHNMCSLVQAEIIVGLCHLAHQVLSPEKRWQFARDHIISIAEKWIDFTLEIASIFQQRFAPEIAEKEIRKTLSIQDKILDTVIDEQEKTILLLLIQLVESTIKTNVNSPTRYGLGFRLSPEIFYCDHRPQKSYGIFFVTGKGFDGFHVRFQDIARGGVRIVQPSNNENYTVEMKNLFDEAYGLSYAQQLKNKDIPEGGSKGVILVKPDANRQKCGKVYIDALLDMTVPNHTLATKRHDLSEQDEFLYLGPDENVTNELINWIVTRAAERKYPLPSAFMSSKPNAGINHKAYGVTSEGVTVFLDEGLKAIGINPQKETFTLKITGGPDGDVAGNEIKILHREYGHHAKITGIADGSGYAEDPNGLNFDELLRLVDNDLPICHFSPKSLSHNGCVKSINDDGGIKERNTLHNRLVTDAFVPAGGRPSTINENNWQEFLTKEGEPSAKLIVEGANLFITPKARNLLAQQGTLIVKDSSANKCGVICSSYEIMASMLLPESIFLEIKDVYVKQVIHKLKEFALLEAKTLFQERKHAPQKDLTALSLELSHEILETTQLIAECIQQTPDLKDDYLPTVIHDFIPPILSELINDNLLEKLPSAYVVRAIASFLASRIVYHEGIEYLKFMDIDQKKNHVLHYLQQELKTQTLINELSKQDFSGKDDIIRILKRGGSGIALKW